LNLKSAPDEAACAECVQAKFPASSMNHSLVPEGTRIGEPVFSDICGEVPVLGYNQEKHFITFTDAASKTLFVEVLKNKKAETVLAGFKKVHNKMKNVFSHSIKRLHTDNGSEYDNDLMLGYLEDEGIEHTTTAPYQPQSNGIAERVNRTLLGNVRAMLLRCKSWLRILALCSTACCISTQSNTVIGIRKCYCIRAHVGVNLK
jgi:hypothetical protein